MIQTILPGICVRYRRDRGIALVVAIILILIIGFWVMTFSSYQKTRIHITAYEGSVAIVEAAAEAAMNLVLAELRLNFDFYTHEAESCTETDWDSTKFGNPVSSAPDVLIANTPSPQGGNALAGLGISGGVYKGTIGDCDFKVKVGRQISRDNENTLAIKEDRIFLRIEAVAQHRHNADINRRLFTIVALDNLNKYCYFDAHEANVIYGVSGNTVPNILETGYIYGGRDLCLGTISTGQPLLYLRNIDGIHTGSNGRIHVSTDGGVRVYHEKIDSVPASGLSMQGNFAKYSTLPSEANEEQLDTIGGILRDRNTGGQDVDFNVLNIRTQALRRANSGQGIRIEAVGSDQARVIIGNSDKGVFSLSDYDNYGTGQNVNTLRINFGMMKIQDPDDAIVDENNDVLLDITYSSDFNGMFYSEVPLEIWGAPDRDMAIYSEQDIFVIGDFNMRTDTSEIVDTKFRFPVQQNYDDSDLHKYIRQTYYEDENGDDETVNYRAYWNYVDVISEGRIWWDYRDPRYYAANELRPLIEYEMALLLLMAVDSDDEITEYIHQFTTDYPTPEVMTILDLGTSAHPWVPVARDNVWEKLIKYPDTGPPSNTVELDDWKSRSIIPSDTYNIGLNSVLKALAHPGVASATDMENMVQFDVIRNYLCNTLLISKDSPNDDIKDAYWHLVELLYNQLRNERWTIAEARRFSADLWEFGMMKHCRDMISVNAPAEFAHSDNHRILFGRRNSKSLINRMASLTISPDRTNYPITSNFGVFSHFIDDKYKNDRFFIPEMTVNAKFKDMGIRNAEWHSKPELLTKDNYSGSVPGISATPAINTIREISTRRTMMGRSPSNSMILRRYGGIAHLRKNTSEHKHDYGYSPPVRRILFDPNFISQFDIVAYNNAVFQTNRIEKPDFNSF